MTWWRPGRWCAPGRRGLSRWKTADTHRSATRPHTVPGCRRWRCRPPGRRSTPGTPSWSRCRAGAMFPRWPAAAVAPSPAAGIAPARCRCPIGMPRVRCAGGAAARNPHCAAPDAGPTPSARSSSAPAGPPKNSAGHFPAPASSPPAATPSCRRCPRDPALVVATPGAEPSAAGGYGAALLLDAWALLGRQDLRAAEDTLRRWMAAAHAGSLPRRRRAWSPSSPNPTVPTVQALIRWDPVGHAEAELDARDEVGLPPAVHMAAVDGAPGGRGRTAGNG